MLCGMTSELNQAPGTVAADYGTTDRYLTQVVLNYIASEVQSNFNLLYDQHFDEKIPGMKQFFIDEIHKKLMYVAKHLLNGKDFLVGNKFSIADSYLYIVLSWGPFLGVDISRYPAIQAYFERVKALPAVVLAYEKMAVNPSSI
jgi:glutathione S-transferase